MPTQPEPPSTGGAYRAWFQCIAGCAGRYSLSDVIYRCPRCGNLLEVRHDLEPLRQRAPQDWKDLFDRRYLRTQWPYGSGVWGKRELVCPVVADENVVSTFEGGTNLFWAERLGNRIGVPDLWIKQCGNSHTGVVQGPGHDRAGVDGQADDRRRARTYRRWPAPRRATRQRRWQPTVPSPACRRSFSLPKGKVSNAQLIQPIAHGALTLSLDTDFDGCMALVQEVCSRHDIYLANSMNSLRIEGQKTISMELVQQFDWEVPDWVVIPRRQPRQRERPGQGLRDDAGAGADLQAAAHRLRTGAARQPPVPELPEGV